MLVWLGEGDGRVCVLRFSVKAPAARETPSSSLCVCACVYFHPSFSSFCFEANKVHGHYGRPSLSLSLSRRLCLLRSPTLPFLPPLVSGLLCPSRCCFRAIPHPLALRVHLRVCLSSSLSVLFVCLSECARLRTVACTCCRARARSRTWLLLLRPSLAVCAVLCQMPFASAGQQRTGMGENSDPPTPRPLSCSRVQWAGGALSHLLTVAVARPDRRTHSRGCTLTCTSGRTVGEGVVVVAARVVADFNVAAQSLTSVFDVRCSAALFSLAIFFPFENVDVKGCGGGMPSRQGGQTHYQRRVVAPEAPWRRGWGVECNSSGSQR